MDVDFVINLIALGTTKVGKSQLIKRYLTHQFSEDYQPTGLEQLSMSIRVGTATAKMQIWDFGGSIQIDGELGRKLFERGDIFLLCFSVDDTVSFETVKNTINLVAPYRGNAFICLVGCKADLRPQLEAAKLAAAAAAAESAQAAENAPKSQEHVNTPRVEVPELNEPAAESTSTPSHTDTVTPPAETSETTPPSTETSAPASTPTPEATQPEAAPVPTPAPAPVFKTGVDKEEAIQLAQQSDMPYFEVSAKTNSDVQAVFHTALIHAYKKHMLKKTRSPLDEQQEQKDIEELRTMIKNEEPTPLVDIFSRDKMKLIFIELFKSRDSDVMTYLSHKNILPQLLDYSLVDSSIPTSHEIRTTREFAVTLFDNNYKLEPLLEACMREHPSLDSIFELFFDRAKFRELPTPRKRAIFRFFSFLLEGQTQSTLAFIEQSKVVKRLVEQMSESEDAKEMLVLILTNEKKWVDKGNEFTLLEKGDIPELLCQLLNDNKFGSIENFFRIIGHVRGLNSPTLADLARYQNFKIPSAVLQMVVDSPHAYDAAVFFSDTLLKILSQPTPSTTEPTTNTIETLISSHFSTLTTLLTSPTLSRIHMGLTLINSLVQSPLPLLSKPFLVPCLDVLFKHPFANVIHFIVVDIVRVCFTRPHEELVNVLVDEGKIVDRILQYSKTESVPASAPVSAPVGAPVGAPDSTTSSDSADGGEGSVATQSSEGGAEGSTVTPSPEGSAPVSAPSSVVPVGVGFRGHLFLMAKFINECPLMEAKLLENEAWQKFADSPLRLFLNKSIFPPTSEQLAAKQRQAALKNGNLG